LSGQDDYAKSTTRKFNFFVKRPYKLSAASRVSSVLTSRYANALLDLAEDQKLVEKVESDIVDLKNMVEESEDLRNTVMDPRVDKSEQFAVVEALAKKAKFQKLTLNFLNVLVENRRLDILEAVIATISKELSKRRGEKVAHIKVAQDLSAKQVKELETALAKASGKPVALNIEVDPSLLGGMIVTMDSRMVDDSVAGKLERLKLAMSKGSNENQIKNLKEVS